MNYIDQVVEFIEKNVKPVTIGQGQDDFVDPFTGNRKSNNNDEWLIRVQEPRDTEVATRLAQLVVVATVIHLLVVPVTSPCPDTLRKTCNLTPPGIGRMHWLRYPSYPR